MLVDVSKKRLSFGICTVYDDLNQLNFEKRTLVDEASKYYDEVLLIDTRKVRYEFLRNTSLPIIEYEGRSLAELSSLHVRSTKGRETSTAVLVRAVSLCGCDIFDPLERFGVGFASKILSTIGRFRSDVGTDSYIVFDLTSALDLIDKIDHYGKFPLISKPIAGKHGYNTVPLNTRQEAIEFASAFFRDRSDRDTPLYLQSFELFVKEYRVLIADGVPLGVVEKLKREGSVAANLAQGGTIVSVDAADVVSFAVQHVSQTGVVGVDVAVDDFGSYHLLEANRAPDWEAFQKATGVNVAERIIRRSIERLSGEMRSPDLEWYSEE